MLLRGFVRINLRFDCDDNHPLFGMRSIFSGSSQCRVNNFFCKGKKSETFTRKVATERGDTIQQQFINKYIVPFLYAFGWKVNSYSRMHCKNGRLFTKTEAGDIDTQKLYLGNVFLHLRKFS